MRKIHGLVAALAAGGLGLTGLLTAGASSATTNPGTTGAGGWQFLTFDQTFKATNGIQLAKTSTSSSTSTAYQAQVQQPINSDGSSIFSAKSRTIPIRYKVQKQSVTTTTTTTTDTVYPGLLDSESSGSPVASNLLWTPPASSLTVGQITNLAADFSWVSGENHSGSMYWIINTPAGNVWVYYGTPTAPFTGTNGSGVNMTTTGDPRVENTQIAPGHSPQYDTWGNVTAGASNTTGTVANEPVNWIGLAVDEGSQQVQLQDVTIATTATGTSTYTPGTIAGGTTTSSTATAWTATTSDPAWVYLYKTSSATPGQVVDEPLVDTQGDSGGQYRVVDSTYMYNFPVSNLPDLSASYKVGISFSPNGSNPVGVVPFGVK